MLTSDSAPQRPAAPGPTLNSSRGDDTIWTQADLSSSVDSRAPKEGSGGLLRNCESSFEVLLDSVCLKIKTLMFSSAIKDDHLGPRYYLDSV